MGRYDKRNRLNDLTGKEWLKMTKSFYTSERSAHDKGAFKHPAPFLIKDVEKLITMFTKKEMIVLDPFVGSGTTLIACEMNNRKGYGIDLNPEYKDLAESRFQEIGLSFDNQEYIIGNSLNVLDQISDVDYIITSPPYHNILRNKGKGIRKDNSDKGYRSGSREGVEYYSEHPDDLGNKEEYQEFLDSFKEIMLKAYKKLNQKKYCSIIISDFTVNRKEVNVQGDIVRLMEDVGYKFVGTIILLQDSKPLYPFGYPYAFKINHMHQNILNFRKVEEE